MKLKKIIRNSLKALLILFVAVFAYFVYLAIWTYRFNADQKKIVENIDAGFCQTSHRCRHLISTSKSIFPNYTE